MKAFVTGGTGFIGGYVIEKLAARGYEVAALARNDKGVAKVEALGAKAIRGDITDPDSMREAMQGSQAVFHIAALYQVGRGNLQRMEQVNVEGTRKVLTLAHELGVPKIVYTSTVGVFGDTHGKAYDETYRRETPPTVSAYELTKWQAHYEVALPLIEAGAPIVIVMPGGVYGPDGSSVTDATLAMWYQGKLPVVPGADTGLTWAHVEDIAEGHVLAAEKGTPGESYLIVGPVLTFGSLLDICADLLGRPRPRVRIPGRLLRPFAPLLDWIDSYIELPELYSGEATASLGRTWYASNQKARRELGWQPRPIDEGMAQTLTWLGETHGEIQPPAIPDEKKIAGAALAAAALILLIWLLRRRK
jgi:nucleoside-diphosphate-sugar epimerase